MANDKAIAWVNFIICCADIMLSANCGRCTRLLDHQYCDIVTLTEWNDFVSERIGYWLKLYQDWIKRESCGVLEYSKDLFLVQHEDLLEEAKLESVISSMVKFLNFPVDNERMACILRHGKGMSSHHR